MPVLVEEDANKIVYTVNGPVDPEYHFQNVKDKECWVKLTRQWVSFYKSDWPSPATLHDGTKVFLVKSTINRITVNEGATLVVDLSTAKTGEIIGKVEILPDDQVVSRLRDDFGLKLCPVLDDFVHI